MVDRAPGQAGHGEASPVHGRLVSFQGDGAGEAELTWGQQALWQVMQDKHTWLPIGTVLPLPAGTTIDDAVEDLRFVMNNYPSMRTRLRLGPAGPRQVVASAGEIQLEVVDAADDEDPAAVAKQVQRRYWHGTHDYLEDWPVRMAVIRHRGVLTHRVWVMCHLVTDGTGSRTVLDELASQDPSASGAAMSAVAQARWQQSPAGQRQCDAVLRHWEKILRRVPTRRFPPRSETPHPRYWQATFNSPALELAVPVIAARSRTEPASVLLAVFAVALARVTGTNPVVLQVVVSNRFRPGLAATVSPIMQNGVCALELPSGPLDAAVAHTRQRAMAAYKYAYYDPAQRDALIAQISQERGEPVDLGCYFNDRRLRPRAPAGPPPSPAQLHTAAAHASFEWTHKQDEHPFDQLYVNVDDVPDTVQLTILTDVHHLSPDAVEACARDMQEIAVASALDPNTATGVPAVAGSGGQGP